MTEMGSKQPYVTYGCGCTGTVHDPTCWAVRPATIGNQPPQPREFGPCVKCGGDNIGVSYHDAKPHCKKCKQDDPPSCRYDHCGRKGEHLKVWCFRCQYRWLEGVSSGIPHLPPANPTLMGAR